MTAVPESEILRIEFEAVLVTAMFPPAVPALCGANITLNGWLCPGAKLIGGVKPPKLKAAPVMEACEIVTLELLEFVIVPVIDWDDPSCVVPKFRLVGFVASGPEPAPIPEREIVVLLERCLPLLPIGVQVTTDMLPLAVPLACGAKVTDKFALCCGAKVIGKPRLVKLNPAPETAACEMVRFDFPLLLAAIDSVPLLPT